MLAGTWRLDPAQSRVTDTAGLAGLIGAGAPPMLRIRGSLVPVDGQPVLTPADTRELVYAILNNSQRQRLETPPDDPSATVADPSATRRCSQWLSS